MIGVGFGNNDGNKPLQYLSTRSDDVRNWTTGYRQHTECHRSEGSGPGADLRVTLLTKNCHLPGSAQWSHMCQGAKEEPRLISALKYRAPERIMDHSVQFSSLVMKEYRCIPPNWYFISGRGSSWGMKRNFPSVACVLIRRINCCNIFVVKKNYGTYIDHLLRAWKTHSNLFWRIGIL